MNEQEKQNAIKAIEKAISLMLQVAYANEDVSLNFYNSCAELNEVKLLIQDN